MSLSEAFQRRTGLPEAEALGRVYVKAPTSDAEMPFAVIAAQPVTWRTYSGGAQNHMRPSGELWLFLQCGPSPNVPEECNVDRRREAADWFDEVVEDVAALSAADDEDDGTSHLAINDITPSGFDEETPEATQTSSGVVYWSTWVVQWGYVG